MSEGHRDLDTRANQRPVNGRRPMVGLKSGRTCALNAIGFKTAVCAYTRTSLVASIMEATETSSAAVAAAAAAPDPSSAAESAAENAEPATAPEKPEQAEPKKPHPLHTNWTFYINELPSKQSKDPTAKHEGHQLRCLGKCSTVEEFWNEFKKTERPSQLQYTEAFYLMREPFDPQWEKPEHSGGGRWRLRHTDVRSADYLWCELAMAAVGEKLSRLVDPHNAVRGVGVSPRPAGVVLEIWTASLDLDAERTTEFAENFNRLVLPHPVNFKLVFYEGFDKARRKMSKA